MYMYVLYIYYTTIHTIVDSYNTIISVYNNKHSTIHISY